MWHIRIAAIVLGRLTYAELKVSVKQPPDIFLEREWGRLKNGVDFEEYGNCVFSGGLRLGPHFETLLSESEINRLCVF